MKTLKKIGKVMSVPFAWYINKQAESYKKLFGKNYPNLPIPTWI